MRTRSWSSLVPPVLVLLASPAPAADGPAWAVTRGEVRVVCPMTVGGSFEAKTGSLSGSLSLASTRPPVLDGELSVDLTTLDTGIGLRNDHLRGEYLEIDKGAGFAKATLSDIQLGDLDPQTLQGRTTFAGTFLLHGTRRPIRGQAEIHRQGPAVRVEASFPLTLADYGIPKPQYLGVGVKGEVQVKVFLVATTEAAPMTTPSARPGAVSR
jgi:hypothetical protein